MAEKIIGDVNIVFNGTMLSLENLSKRSDVVLFDTQGVEELLQFLITLCGSELNRRHTFRVPLWATSGLDVRISKGGKSFRVTPKNISVTGIFVDFPDEASFILFKDAEVTVSLDYDGERQVLPAVVTRFEGNGCGLSFFNSAKGEGDNPPPDFTRLLMNLQRGWIARLEESREQMSLMNACRSHAQQQN